MSEYQLLIQSNSIFLFQIFKDANCSKSNLLFFTLSSPAVTLTKWTTMYRENVKGKILIKNRVSVHNINSFLQRTSYNNKEAKPKAI